VAPTLNNPQLQFAATAFAPPSARRLDAPGAIRLWHLASLDAPTVAVVWALGFGWAARVRLPQWIPILLALSAWAVYIGDRLLDARAAGRAGNPTRLAERHRFHYRYRWILAPLGAAAAVAAAGIVFMLMPKVSRERDSVLAVAALAYFTRVHSVGARPAFGVSGGFRFPNKELLVGVLFTAACVLPAWSRAAGIGVGPLLAPAILFALLAWLNCFAIDRWENAAANRSHVFFPACVLALAGLMIAAALSSIQPRCAALILMGALSGLLLAVLDRLRARLTPLALRAAADLVLLTPMVLLFR
jgi:hypothetical protein